MDDAADIGAHGVDGWVGAEAHGVDSQVCGALVDHIPEDVDLHLGREEPGSVDGSQTGKISASISDVMDSKLRMVPHKALSLHLDWTRFVSHMANQSKAIKHEFQKW